MSAAARKIINEVSWVYNSTQIVLPWIGVIILSVVGVHCTRIIYVCTSIHAILLNNCTCVENIENRIYREELKESLGMNFFSPFQPEREFKLYKSCKCLQIICSRVH